MRLSEEKLSLISKWMYRNARPLDLARWQYHFEEGCVSSVVKALEAYQNSDGGFGNGIEADCLNPNSSPLQTWWAIQFIKEIKLEKDHEMIQGILGFLESKAGTSNDLWQFSIKSNNDYPRAPWWSYSDDDNRPGYNPTAALLGFILTYSNIGRDVYNNALTKAKEILQVYLERDEPSEMHELACFIELYDYLLVLGLDLVDMEKYSKKLNKEVFEIIEQDSSKWSIEYCCKPSHLFESPNSIVYPNNKDIVEDELKFMVESLSIEGTWDVTWSWGDFMEEFAVSRKWWQANIAIKNVRMLKAFA